MRAVARLSFWKLKNSLRTLFTDPRKLVPLLIVLTLVGSSLTIATLAPMSQSVRDSTDSLDPAYLKLGVAIVMVLISFAVIDSGLGDSLLGFPPPDVDYLFPSPISRRVVLAYRLPMLLLSAMFQGLFFVFVLHSFARAMPMHQGNVQPPAGAGVLAVVLCVGIYMNLGLLVSLNYADRRQFRKAAGALVVVFGVAISGLWWLRGVDAVVGLIGNGVFRTIFLPAVLAGDVVAATTMHEAFGSGIAWLLLCYVVTLVPMFLVNSNWYEQSIVSSERVAAIRQAAKGGSAALMAMQAAKFKHRATKTYTVAPFGQGPMALVWAHLSAAAKRPYVNFVAPAVTGISIGVLGGFAGNAERAFGPGVAIGLMFYLTFGFMAVARTASEAAIRRRELLAPLPLRGWESVAANLAMPIVSVLLMSFGFALAYPLAMGPEWPMVVFGALIVYPLRLVARMILQYAVVLGYPDIEDKVQQLLAQGAYYVFAAPFVVGELIVCLPAIALGSIWVGLVSVALYEAGILFFLLILTGRASERAVATGEPINLFRMAFSRSPRA